MCGRAGTDTQDPLVALEAGDHPRQAALGCIQGRTESRDISQVSAWLFTLVIKLAQKRPTSMRNEDGVNECATSLFYKYLLLFLFYLGTH